jgi:hypothetical protein
MLNVMLRPEWCNAELLQGDIPTSAKWKVALYTSSLPAQSLFAFAVRQQR